MIPLRDILIIPNILIMKDERLLRLSDGPSPDVPHNYYYQQQPSKQQKLYFQPNQVQALRLANAEFSKGGKKGLLRFEAAATHERLAPVQFTPVASRNLGDTGKVQTSSIDTVVVGLQKQSLVKKLTMAV